MIKHYIRLDENQMVIKSFTDIFKSPNSDDILVKESDERHFNLDLYEDNGKLKYKFEDGKIVKATEEERSFTLLETKSNKINRLSIECGNIIEKGIEFNGKQYSAKLEDQVNIGVLKPLADAGIDVPWHSDGEGCKPFTSDEFKDFADKLMAHVTYHTTYMGGCKDYINSLEIKEEVESFAYGDELPEEFSNAVANNLALLGIQI